MGRDVKGRRDIEDHNSGLCMVDSKVKGGQKGMGRGEGGLEARSRERSKASVIRQEEQGNRC